MSDIGADLFDLNEIATKSLPHLARAYGAAATGLADTVYPTAQAFDRDPVFGGPDGVACPPWSQLRDAVHDLMSDTSQNIDAVAAALAMAVQIYRTTDDHARQAMDQVRRDQHHF